MGGFGSGRWRRTKSKDTVECFPSLDINWLNRHSYILPGLSVTISWKCGEYPSGSITLITQPGGLTLRYLVGLGDSSEKHLLVEETVILTWTPCNFGGQRPWFICPGVVRGMPCGRRVGKLHFSGKYFVCRHCCNLAYDSQREDRTSRFLRKVEKIRMRLGGLRGDLAYFPPRPKGMHRETYLCLFHRHERFVRLSWVSVERRLRSNTNSEVAAR